MVYLWDLVERSSLGAATQWAQEGFKKRGSGQNMDFWELAMEIDFERKSFESRWRLRSFTHWTHARWIEIWVINQFLLPLVLIWWVLCANLLLGFLHEYFESHWNWLSGLGFWVLRIYEKRGKIDEMCRSFRVHRWGFHDLSLPAHLRLKVIRHVIYSFLDVLQEAIATRQRVRHQSVLSQFLYLNGYSSSGSFIYGGQRWSTLELEQILLLVWLLVS